MRKLVWLGGALAVLVTAWWGGVVALLHYELADWFQARRAEGWQADYASISSAGFPARFDTRISGLELADPASGLAWSLPVFRFTAPSILPTRITAIWPDQQVVATPFERITVQAKDMRAAVHFNRIFSLGLARISADLTDVALSSTRGWQSSLERGHLVMQALPDAAPNTYRLHFEASGVVPASDFLRNFEHVAFMADRIEGAELDAKITFDAPWDRYAIERARPQITHIELERLNARWGEVELSLAGALDVNDAGIPEGQVSVKARNWREMVALARKLGALPEEAEPDTLRALAFLASLSGDTDTLDTPLTFRNGYIAFGPLPLGKAPNLTIR